MSGLTWLLTIARRLGEHSVSEIVPHKYSSFSSGHKNGIIRIRAWRVWDSSGTGQVRATDELESGRPDTPFPQDCALAG